MLLAVVSSCRFLEHSRAFYFNIDGKVKLWLSSADWMTRNMLRRVELAWPILDPALQQRVVDECFTPYLQDNVDAWVLLEGGIYKLASKLTSGEKPAKQIAAQNHLLQIHSTD